MQQPTTEQQGDQQAPGTSLPTRHPAAPTDRDASATEYRAHPGVTSTRAEETGPRISNAGEGVKDALTDHGAVTAAQRTREIAESVGVPYAELSTDLVDFGSVASLPEAFLDENNLLPLSLSEGWLTIAAEDFTDVSLIEAIERQSGCRVQVVAAEAENLRETREQVFVEIDGTAAPDQGRTRIDDLLRSMEVDEVNVVDVDPVDAGTLYDDNTLESMAPESPIVKLVSHIIREAVRLGASDIHIEPHDGVFRVRYRIDGDLRATIHPDLRLLPPVASRIKIMAGLDISERRLPQDGGMTVTIDGRAADLRISTMTTRYGEKVVVRVIDRSAGLIGLDELGFQPRMLESFRAATSLPNGIVLVTGPTGSGKSTTLYAALQELVQEHRNICTVEDPVERQLVGTNQFQVNVQAGFTFARALRSLLRQDPDVVMLGEIRDTETARLATEAAMTGHLVFATLHTNDAITAVPRLINMGVEPYMVAASLRAVLAQRLVRRVCPHCRHAVAMTPLQHEAFSVLFPDSVGPESAWAGSGCRRCGGVGSKGRVGVFEFVSFDEDMLSCITHADGVSRLRDLTRGRGVPTLSDDALSKASDGRIELDAVLRIASSGGLITAG